MAERRSAGRGSSSARDGRRPRRSSNDAHPDDESTGYVSTIFNRMFASCGGVDVRAMFASGADKPMQPSEQIVGTAPRPQQRRQSLPSKRPAEMRGGETFIVPQPGYADDVSAISAHTLEEMERLYSATQQLGLVQMQQQQQRQEQQQQRWPALIPSDDSQDPSFRQGTHPQSNSDWGFQIMRPTKPSYGVSTSGSTSTEEDPRRVAVVTPSKKHQMDDIRWDDDHPFVLEDTSMAEI